MQIQSQPPASTIFATPDIIRKQVVTPAIAPTFAGATQTATGTGALTGTGTSRAQGLLGPLPDLALPSSENVAADIKALGDELRMVLAVAGIQSDPPVEMRIDGQGRVQVDPDDPRRAAIENALSQDPDLGRRLAKLVGDAQLLEQGAAVAGWYDQVAGGVSGDQANRNLMAAADQINRSTGFTLAGDDLTLEVTGLGKSLMAGNQFLLSEDEIIFRETLRLTDRQKDSVEQDKKGDGANDNDDGDPTSGGNASEPMLLSGQGR